jgi:hypothetical protein
MSNDLQGFKIASPQHFTNLSNTIAMLIQDQHTRIRQNAINQKLILINTRINNHESAANICHILAWY